MSTINTLPPQGGGVVRVEDYLPWTADDFPPGTFDGFTHEMMLDVQRAARDAAHATVARLLGRAVDGLHSVSTFRHTVPGFGWESICTCGWTTYDHPGPEGRAHVLAERAAHEAGHGRVAYRIVIDADDMDSAVVELDALPVGTVIADEGGWSWRRIDDDLWTGPDGVVASDHVFMRSKDGLTVVSAPSEAVKPEDAVSDARIQMEVSR